MKYDDFQKHTASADYKALRGAAILARHREKEARCRIEQTEEGQMAKLDELFSEVVEKYKAPVIEKRVELD